MTFLKLGLYLFLMLMIGCVRQLTSQRMNAPATAETPPELATAGKAFAAAIEKLGQGEQADAEDFLDGALQNFPDDQRLVFLRGVCERSRFSIRGAMPYFGKTVTLNPTTTEALCANLVMRLDMRKNSAENFNALRLLVAGHPDDVLLQWMLAVQCRAYTNKLEGIAHYREVCKHFDTPPVLVHQTMGNLLDGACLYDEARPCRDIALRQERAGWTLNAMGALFIDQRRYTDAVAYFAEAVAVSPRVNYHWQNQVRNLLALRRWEEALEQVEQGLRQFPDDEKLRWQKAQALEELGRHEEAARAFLACGGHDAHGRARNIFLLTGRADEARKLLPISQPLPPYEKRPPAEQLIWAAMAGDAEKVRALLAAGDASLRASLDLGRTIQPPGFTPRRYTALIVAAWQGHATVVELLLKNGASPDAADNNRCTPLMYAAQWHQNQVIERLLAGGAKLDLRCQWGETALFLATVHRNVIGARLLLKAGANPALSKVAEGALNCVVNHEDLELLELMHQRMDCFEQPAPKTGRNTLMHVIVHGYWHVCDQLLAWQAQVNRADAEGQTPLMLAMRGRGTGLWGEWSPAYAHSLVEHGADVNAENHAGQTALDLAALVGADDLVAYLKQHGAQRGVPRFPRWICDEQINTEARRRAVAMVAPLAAKECGEVSAFGTSARRVFPDPIPPRRPALRGRATRSGRAPPLACRCVPLSARHRPARASVE